MKPRDLPLWKAPRFLASILTFRRANSGVLVVVVTVNLLISLPPEVKNPFLLQPGSTGAWAGAPEYATGSTPPCEDPCATQVEQLWFNL